MYRRQSLGDLCDIVVGRTPSRSDPSLWNGKNPWLSIADMGKTRRIASTKEQVSEKGAQLFNGRQAHPGTVLLSFKLSIGKVGIAEIPLFTNEAIAALPIRDPSLLNPDYLARYLEQADLISSTNRAAMGRTLNLPLLRSIQIPVPPLPEQRRIAAILDQADELRFHRRRALALLDVLSSDLYLSMFSDEGGQSVELQGLVSQSDRINYGVVQPGNDLVGGAPIIRVGDLRNGRVDRRHLKRISSVIESKHSKSRLRGSEILVSCVGTIGTIALVSERDVGSNVARAVARVPVGEAVERVYLAAQLKTHRVQAYFRAELRTVSQPTLNIKQLAETAIYLAPRHKQVEFASRMLEIDSLRGIHERARLVLDELFASLQHRAFKGEL